MKMQNQPECFRGNENYVADPGFKFEELWGAPVDRAVGDSYPTREDELFHDRSLLTDNSPTFRLDNSFDCWELPLPVALWTTFQQPSVPSTSHIQRQGEDNGTTGSWSPPCEENEGEGDLTFEAPSAAFEYMTSGKSLPPLQELSWSPTSSHSTASPPQTPIQSTTKQYTAYPHPPPQSTKITKRDRLEKRREKNRTSQRKYRERKEKYIHDLEQQCRDLQRKYDLLVGLLPDGRRDTLELEELGDREEWKLPEADES
ncbi:uncharacterized protein BP5553_03804 [Venustampulla echinocandica]|uniref:BZIP domain-containing protein n=1 Tax=Venustampulla echinocandica TaxID=2656787 RepID=A0A370TVA0_9HELO|nr:uncharacterized protein BP5553_03804 [Venustampulla echinocandica]RDL39464.1 hypothetical protein BP5553_03804 [Venustampulla echinocandica]